MQAYKANEVKGIPDLLGTNLAYLLRLSQVSAHEDPPRPHLEGACGVPKASTSENALEGDRRHLPSPHLLCTHSCNASPNQSHPGPRILPGLPRRLGNGPTPVWSGPEHFCRQEVAESPLWPTEVHRRWRLRPFIDRCYHADVARWGLLSDHHGHCTGVPCATEGGPGQLVSTVPPNRAIHEGHKHRDPVKGDVAIGIQPPGLEVEVSLTCFNHPPTGCRSISQIGLCGNGRGGGESPSHT